MNSNIESKFFQDAVTISHKERRKRIEELISKDFLSSPKFYINMFDKLGYTLSKKVI